MAFSIASGLGIGGFGHRLSKMYQDTKNLYDFTEPPKVSVSEAPELSSLHRKLRIQKDRLITWGLQWSSPTSNLKSGDGQPADIDESLDKAGLGDVVGSVLATIKEIIAEADPLWQSSRSLITVGGGDEKLAGGLSRIAGEKKRAELVQWDRARFEGLVHDLTISIDTLYDISKNRQRPPKPRSDSTKQSKREMAGMRMEEQVEKAGRTSQFESSRMQTPQQIEPGALFRPGYPRGDNLSTAPLETRQIVYMRRRHTANNPWKQDGGIPIIPVLLEYAAFDPIFASTGIAPPMDRFEKLFAGLQNSRNATHQEFNVPKLIGYFEAPEEARFGLVYELPSQYGPLNEANLEDSSVMPMISTVADLLASHASPPALEGKFRLAYNLATTVFKLQAKDIIHGNVASDNVIFFHQRTERSTISSQDYDICQAFLTNFDLFSVTENGGLSSYREHVDVQYSSDASVKESGRAMDLRGLALLLLEIGLWSPIGQVKAEWWSSSSDDRPKVLDSDFLLPSEICTRLAAQCGTLYMKAVQSCWHAGNLDMIQSSQRDPSLQVKMYWKVVKALEKCCALDEDFELEEVDTETLSSQALALFSHQPTAEPYKPARPASASTVEKPTAESKTTTFRDSQPSDDIKLAEVHTNFEGEDNSDDNCIISERQWAGGARKVRRHSAQDNMNPTEILGQAWLGARIGATFQSKEHWSRLRTGVSTGEKSQEVPLEASQSPPNRGEKIGLYAPSIAPKIDVPARAVVPASKRKLRLFPTTNIPQQYMDDWQGVLMPRINHLLRGFYRSHPESVEISLVNMGETPQRTKPTILAICTSVKQVKSILKKSFSYDKSVYDLKVCKGKILRSRKNRPPNRSNADPLAIEEHPAVNTDHQVYPRFGASIGACVEGRHLPPVSLGGILEIDGIPYGMSVHHMLDEDDDLEDIEHDEATNPHRSSGYSAGSDSEGAFYYSSDDVMQSGTESESPYEYETEDEDLTSSSSDFLEPGDKEGIPVDCGDGYYITQPAIDDVADQFFSSPDERDEEHIECHGLGEMYASSGIRRTSANGQAHEIDWALFTFNNDRLPPPTLIQEGQRRFCKQRNSYPSGIVPYSDLRNLQVHCMGRSSGLRAGKISSGMTSVKIYGRKTPSQSYEVHCTEKQGNMLGIPGDSGAWVIEDGTGRVCGSVLAWSQRKRVAYICPMDVLVEDIARTVEAGRICLGSGEVVVDKVGRGVVMGGWKSEGGMKGEMPRKADILSKRDSDSDFNYDSGNEGEGEVTENETEEERDEENEDNEDDDADDEDEEEDEEKQENRHLSSVFKPSQKLNLQTAPIRFSTAKERDLPDLIPALDKMRIGAEGKRMTVGQATQIAGSVK